MPGPGGCRGPGGGAHRLQRGLQPPQERRPPGRGVRFPASKAGRASPAGDRLRSTTFDAEPLPGHGRRPRRGRAPADTWLPPGAGTGQLVAVRGPSRLPVPVRGLRPPRGRGDGLRYPGHRRRQFVAAGDPPRGGPLRRRGHRRHRRSNGTGAGRHRLPGAAHRARRAGAPDVGRCGRPRRRCLRAAPRAPPELPAGLAEPP